MIRWRSEEGRYEPRVPPSQVTADAGSAVWRDPKKCSFTPGRRCRATGVTDRAPASRQIAVNSSSWAGSSDQPGMIGAASTPVGMPAAFSLLTASTLRKG